MNSIRVPYEAMSHAAVSPLQAVFEPATIAEQLSRGLTAASGSPPRMRIQILERRRTHCTFGIEWPEETPPRSVIGKMYAADRLDVYQAMDTIRLAGFGPDDVFSIPQPLGYLPDLRLLLLQNVSGVRAKHVLLTGVQRDRVAAAERCARWLVRFHAVAPHTGQPFRVAEVLDSLDEWSHPFVATGLPLVRRANRLRHALERAAGRLEPTKPCGGHGHYTCRQVVLSQGHRVRFDSGAVIGLTGSAVLRGERTVALECDKLDLADPCRDLASFLVDLKRLAWKHPACSRALDHAAESFLNTYRACSRTRVGDNLPFYAAARCLRLAARDLAQRRNEPRAEATLDQGLRILEQGLSAWTIDSTASLPDRRDTRSSRSRHADSRRRSRASRAGATRPTCERGS
jgi:hypothetical protein